MLTNPDQLPAGLRRVHAYWVGQAEGGMLPGRQAIDPVAMRHDLPDICLVELVEEATRRRYRYRLVGTRVADRMGQDFTGAFFDEFLLADRLADIMAAYDRCVDTRAPQYDAGTVPVEGREFVSYQRILLPLAADGVHVDMLLAAFAFDG